MSLSLNIDRVWVLLIIEGSSVDLPVEVYLSHAAAVREAGRWAWTFAGHGEIHIDTPSSGHWRVGVRDVRLVACGVSAFDPDAEWWVGAHWTNDGYPDPEAKLLPSRAAARSWTLGPPDGESLISHAEQEWSMAASFGRGDERSHSVSSLAKVVLGPDAATVRALAEYRIELTGTFVQGLSTSLFAPPGLPRESLEELVEQAWGELSSGSHVLLESSWELVSYSELPPSPPMRP